MLRFQTPERPNWRASAEEFGFKFHTMHGQAYWDETRYYQFTLNQIEQDLEAPTEEIHQMCLAAVDQVLSNDSLLQAFRIPERFWAWIRQSWLSGQPSLYSRLDFAYNGSGPAKLLENNADTPTSLYETGFWQWLWLEDKVDSGVIHRGADQFNSLQDQLVNRFKILAQESTSIMHFACCKDTEEDRATVQYMQDCAEEAGIETAFVYIEDIGLSDCGQFSDLDNNRIQRMFKLYPWEFMFQEDYGEALLSCDVQWFEPPWKAILSNKALLPLLWSMYPNHPNLLPAYFEGDARIAELDHYVKKPIFAREGSNVSVVKNGEITHELTGPYGEEGFIYQAYTPLPKFGDDYALIGSWLVNDQAAGISIREDSQQITADLSRYIPHIILD